MFIKLSPEFKDAFCNFTSSCCETCHCGRVFYDVENDWDWKKGELEAFEIDLNATPVHGAISGIYINNKFFVYDCDCKGLRWYEAFIIKHETQIAEYLNARAKGLKKKASKIEVSIEERR